MRLIYLDNKIIENFPAPEDNEIKPTLADISYFAELNEEQLDLFNRYFILRQTQTEIARDLGISQSYVCKKLNKTYKKIKRLINKYGYYK